jgi:hypothetical protein
MFFELTFWRISHRVQFWARGRVVATEESLNHVEGRGGRGEVLKPRGGHHEKAGDQ